MKKVVVASVMVLATMAVLAQTQPAAQPAKDQSSSPRVIKDPTEYNVYMAAFNTQDPKQKAAAMESFIQQYPNSIVHGDALEQLMDAYTANNNGPKMEDTAVRILKDSPNNMRALAIATSLERAKGTLASAAAAGDYAKKGLEALPNWSKPEGITDADFEKAKSQMEEIFDGAAGFAALQSKDYAAAHNFYVKSFQKDPNNLQDVYQLALTDLNMTPIALDGFWYGAKAISLAAGNADAANTIAQDIKYRYKKYHGNKTDWDKFAATTVGQKEPPSAADLAKLIPPPPTLCDYAVEVVQKNKPEELGFDDKEFVLARVNCSPANKDAADKVWQAILNKQKAADGSSVKLKLPVLVISATKDTIQAAITEENQQAKKADLTVELEKPVLRPPAPGTTIEVVGTMTKYAPDPFMFTMEQGGLPGAKPATTPKRPVHRAANQKPARL